ncbi:MAG: CidA/LrgA family protein [Lachnospiraceae bacterium]|nr:CidA/LrgA family protein [Lachnospiraceae bacterium]
MKYIFQIGIIAGISFVAELLYIFLPLPVPASVYGLIILFILLCMKVIKLEQIEDVADFMLAIMPILFIEPSVGLMTSFEAIKGQAVVLVLMCILSTVVVTTVTGLVAQTIIRIRNRKDEMTVGGKEHE